MGAPWYNYLTPPTALNALSASAGGPSYNGGNAVGGIKNTLEGDPASANAQMQQLMQLAFTQGNKINSMLQGEKAQSEKYFQPMQQMFGQMYGSKGIKPAMAPGVPGSSPLASMFGSGGGTP